VTHATALIAGIAAAVLIPSLVLLYFLKLRRKDVDISTTLLWRRAIEDLQANAPFQKLRRNILLLLQLLALAAGLYALADPAFQTEREGGDRHVILIDRSASMASIDGDTDDPGRLTRLEAAKREALDLVDSLAEPQVFGRGRPDEAMVIAFDSSAEVRQTFTSDKAQLRAAIEAIEQTDAPTRFAEAIALARAHAPKRMMQDTFIDEDGVEQTRLIEGPMGPVGKIHVFTDGALPDAHEASVHYQDELLPVRVGGDNAGNVGITSMRAMRDYVNRSELSVFVGLENSGTSPAEVDVELIIDGVVAEISSVSLPGVEAPPAAAPPPAERNGQEDAPAPPPERPPPATGGVEFDFVRPQGGVIAVAIRTDGDNVLPTDDAAWIVVPAAERLRIALVTEGNLFARTAIEALPTREFREFTPAAWDTLPERERDFDVVVLDGWLPDAGGDPLPPGRFIVLGAVPTEGAGLGVSREAERSVIVDTEDHPALHNISFDAVTIFEQPVVEIGPDSPAKVLARSSAGPAILELATAGTRALIVPFDVTESSWGVDKSFILFIAKAARYLGEEGTAAVGRIVQPGEVYSDRLPPGIPAARVRDPSGREQAVTPAEDGQIVYGPVERVGVYRVVWDGGARPFTSNLLDPDESDVRTAERITLASTVAEAQRSGSARATVRLWPWLLLAALVVMLFEWFIYNRKVQV